MGARQPGSVNLALLQKVDVLFQVLVKLIIKRTLHKGVECSKQCRTVNKKIDRCKVWLAIKPIRFRLMLEIVFVLVQG